MIARSDPSGEVSRDFQFYGSDAILVSQGAVETEGFEEIDSFENRVVGDEAGHGPGEYYRPG